MQERGRNVTNVISLLGAFVAVSVVLGLLGAGLMMPIVAATGSAARGGVAVFDALPGEFAQNPLSEQSRILASDGSLIATPYDENRIIVPLAQIAPIMQKAQIAIEDSRFYAHGGVDPQGMGRAVISNARGGDTQGASTLTQQYVKITLQENALRNDDIEGARAAVAKNYTRKLQELKYAVTLERTLTKDQILQGYLNLVYYGGQAYGVEAAARHFFGVKASKLNLPQAATLAGMVQLPSQTDPTRSPDKALARRNVVLDRMHALNQISDKAWKSARKSKLRLNPTPARNSCALSRYPYFCEYIDAYLLEMPALGKTRAEREKRIKRGGLTIHTSLNPKIQRYAQQEINAKVPKGNSADIGAAAAVVEPGTGNVLAIAQNTTYSLKEGVPGETSVNWAVDEKDGGSGGFAFGSTAKMFAVATAVESGMGPSSIVFARQASPTAPAIFGRSDFNSSDDCKLGAGQIWSVENDEGKGNGNITLTDATARSVNTAFAGLVGKLGACKVRDMMSKMGLRQGTGGKPIGHIKSKFGEGWSPSAITLGSDSVSPLSLAAAYATVASGGMYCVPNPVLTITTSDKKLLTAAKGQCKRALEPEVAKGTTEILKSVLTKGTARGLGGLAGQRPVAGKTGTHDGGNETWFVGYTPQLATAVWVGTPDDDRNARVVRNISLAGKSYPVLFGSSIAAPVWKLIMDRSLIGMPVLDFGEGVAPIPDVTGMTVKDARAALSDAKFKWVIGGAVNSRVPAGRAAGTQPQTEALRGTTVVILVSTGKTAPKANAPNPAAASNPAAP